jgi:hypothetical protein
MTRRYLSEHIIDLEDRGLQFYRDCMRITNQFSTKYILGKVLKRQQAHVKRLKSEIFHLRDNVDLTIDINVDIDVDIDDFLKCKLPQEFDREHLNFVEATKLALRMSDYYLEMYRRLFQNSTDIEKQNLLKCVIEKKNEYTEQLKKEYERLRYK